jgi:hypothetical protein
MVAIPANNDAERIGACFAAAVMQRDFLGAPLPSGAFALFVFAKNCTDETASVTRWWAAASPHSVTPVEEVLPRKPRQCRLGAQAGRGNGPMRRRGG